MDSDSDPSNTSHLNYLDFELEIGPGLGREYPVAIIHSPAGEARETMRFPFDELALESRLKDLQIALLHSGGRRRKVLSPEEQTVQAFGQALFDALLTGELRSRYDVSRREAAQHGKGLRLKLRIQSPELAALPWEFLYDRRQAEYVCLSRHTPVVRYLELPQPPRPLAVSPPLRILGMIASPQDQVPLDIEREKQRVERAIKDLRGQRLVDLTWLAGQTWRDLQRKMRRGPWHVFHFTGHGGFDRNTDEGFVALADDDGQTRRMSATLLARLLADQRSLGLVVLNACEGARGGQRDVFSSTAAILVRRGIPAVLAMQYEITDRAAIEFARAFYEALADGMPVDAAVAEARKAISLAVANTVEWGTLVLYMRAPDGRIFTPVAAPPRDLAVPVPVPVESEEKRPPTVLLPREQPPAPIRPPFEAEMILIPAGEFLMGSDPKKDKRAKDAEQPQHTLYLPDYYLAKTPVTNARYAAFVQAVGHHLPSHWQGGKPPRGKEDHPVVNVSWEDALTYCRWLAEVTGKPYRLPSEAEWEKGARGTNGRIYPWGDRWDAARCNSREGGKGDTTPVVAYPDGASPYGLLDMAGNVWEWTCSLWGKGIWKPNFKYPYNPKDGRENPDAPGDIRRVLRGGAFFYNERHVRCAVRDWDHPYNRLGGIGFRVVVSP
jgi:formylglycine-generating enzyme required for sulfatase activity